MPRKPSVRKRRFFKRITGYVTEPVTRRVRVAARREQRHRIGGHDFVLPPSHKLPYYLERDPRYDVYAAGVLGRLAEDKDSVRIIDVGANVGDTAVIALSAAHNISVTSVEGNPAFLSYARRNLAAFGERSTLIERFVGPIAGLGSSYGNDGSTGGFGPSAQGLGQTADTPWVTPQELLAQASDDDLVIWKSDTDGLDIHLLVEHWTVIDETCDVIWFEYDPFETLGDTEDIPRLWQQLGASGRGVIVYDNLGNRMLSVPPGGDVERIIAELTGWLGEQRESHMEVAYFDLWALRPEVWFEVPRHKITARHT